MEEGPDAGLRPDAGGGPDTGGGPDAGEGPFAGGGPDTGLRPDAGAEHLMLVGRSDGGGQPAPRCTQSCDYKSL